MTTEQISIVEGNKLIAEFMGEKVEYTNKYDDGTEKYFLWFTKQRLSIDQLKYSTSWDWIMPVVQKIGKIEIINAGVEGCELYDNIDYALRPAKIEVVWLAVTEFIQWYSKNKA